MAKTRWIGADALRRRIGAVKMASEDTFEATAQEGADTLRSRFHDIAATSRMRGQVHMHDLARDLMLKSWAIHQSKAPSWDIQVYRSSECDIVCAQQSIGRLANRTKTTHPQLHLHTCSLLRGGARMEMVQSVSSDVQKYPISVLIRAWLECAESRHPRTSSLVRVLI